MFTQFVAFYPAASWMLSVRKQEVPNGKPLLVEVNLLIDPGIDCFHQLHVPQQFRFVEVGELLTGRRGIFMGVHL